MSVTGEDFVENLITDCKLYLDGLENFETLSPYSLILDYYNMDLSHRVVFPPASFELPRAEQFHMLSVLLNLLNHSGVGLVSFMSLEVGAHSAIDERFWNREVLIALVGASHPSSKLDSSVLYESAVVFFDKDDAGELYFSIVKDNESWKDFVDNTAIFRDFLYHSSMSDKGGTPFRWPDLYKTLVNVGFDFQFENDDTKSQFIVSQPALYATSV